MGRIVMNALQTAKFFAQGDRVWMTCVKAKNVPNLRLSAQGTTNVNLVDKPVVHFWAVKNLAQAKEHYKRYPFGAAVFIKADSNLGMQIRQQPNGDALFIGELPPCQEQYCAENLTEEFFDAAKSPMTSEAAQPQPAKASTFAFKVLKSFGIDL